MLKRREGYTRPHEEALVFIERNNKGRVKERTIETFKNAKELSTMWKLVQQAHPEIEIHKINIRNETPPQGPEQKGKYWCPYCAAYRKFINEDDYYRCEICTITERDFYTVRYNKKFAERQRKGM